MSVRLPGGCGSIARRPATPAERRAGVCGSLRWLAVLLLAASCPLAFAAETSGGDGDPYTHYISTSKDFLRVGQDRDFALKAWPGWYYMPWPFRWAIGYDEAAGTWCLRHGYNGAQLDFGRTEVDGVDKLAWIEQFGLRFYVDHTAGKGDLFLWSPDEVGPNRPALWSPGVRPVPLDEATMKRLKERISKSLQAVKDSPMRAAYALDDEPSWGYLSAPCMWRLVEDMEPYRAWLREVYGGEAAPRPEEWITYDAVFPKLEKASLRELDCSALMDQWSFNDSLWCNWIGDLTTFCNGLDPDTPCGIVGAQAPGPFGGYDYAKLMRKVQFIEAYDLGDSQAIVRSFNPQGALPVVTTHFRRIDPSRPSDVTEMTWRIGYYLAHGNAGMIGWVDGWFDEASGEPLPWHDAAAPRLLEATGRIGPLARGARWIHDGVAIYYSHASVQLGWILDAQAHGRTWRNRKEDHLHGASSLVRHAWENMLRDEGLQYDFLSYADVIEEGIPPEYKVLILPAALCLSDGEARRIEAFCQSGGLVIADYLPGVFDQHGRGRAEGGVLDGLFGAKHDPGLKAPDVFQERLWTEVDQEARYEFSTFTELMEKENSCLPGPGGFHKAVRSMETGIAQECGKGRAVLMNLSPQMYNAFREQGPAAMERREVFMKPLREAGLTRWVWLEEVEESAQAEPGKTAPSGADGMKYEITYFAKEGRILLFVCCNPDRAGLSLDLRGPGGPTARERRIRLRFRRPIRHVRDERSGRALGDGDCFELAWRECEVIVLSFDGSGRPE